MPLPKKYLASALVVLLLIALATYWSAQRENEDITATGMIEITQADLTSKVSGYLAARHFQEGDNVTRGQTLAQIDTKDLTLQYWQAANAYQSAQAKLDDLLAGARAPELTSASAVAQAAQDNYTKAQADYDRFQKLFASGAIAAQTLDNYRLALTTSANALRQAQAAYQLVSEGTRTDLITAQRYAAAQAKAAMDAAASLLADADLKSPLTGRVLRKNYEVGEFIAPGAPLATIGDLSDCWVKIYVPSTLLGKVSLDQQARVKIDSYPGQTFTGRVREIATEAEFTPRQTITKNERANLVFAVKIALDNAQGIFKPGMPAEVSLP